MEMSRLTRDGTAEPISRDQIFRRERGQGNIHFPCSADHEQDRQPYPVDPYSCCMCNHTMSKRVNGNIDCKDKFTQKGLIGFLNVYSIGSTLFYFD